MPYTTEEHQKASANIPRDEYGHFTSSAQIPSPHPLHQEGFLRTLLTKNIISSNTKDPNTLIDIHVGNPLRRIVQLLEDIKKQKAFSFSIKGSLGIAGVVLTITTLGIFGGTTILCNKGYQSYLGTIKTLQYSEAQPPNPSPLAPLFSFFTSPSVNTQRTILIRPDSSTIHVVEHATGLNFDQYANSQVIATGTFDSCSQTLTVSSPTAMEINK